MEGWSNNIKMGDNKRATSRTSRLTNFETSVLTYEQTQLHKFTWNDFLSFPGTFRQTQLKITCLVFGRLFSPRGDSTPFRVMTSTCGASPLHSMDTPQSVGFLWTSDQPIAETSTWHHTTVTTEIHAHGGLRTHNPSKRAAADPRLKTARPLGPSVFRRCLVKTYSFALRRNSSVRSIRCHRKTFTNINDKKLDNVGLCIDRIIFWFFHVTNVARETQQCFRFSLLLTYI